jgi:hypothetical protein
MALFTDWGLRQAGLFTWPESPKHVHLYQKFGFWLQYLVPLMSKAVSPIPADPRLRNVRFALPP